MSQNPDDAVPAPAQPSAPSFEQRLPAWQRVSNSFLENWIFAFLIAMALRHFFLEAYRIPTASMEPTLYGDVAFSKADHVVVDKMGFRFTGPSRWGVTVFQYPVPEVQAPGGGEMKAITPDGERLDSFPFRPLLQRNFVKRCVGMPDDVFYIEGGDLWLQQADGSFGIPAKPPRVQKALWLPIYQHGADPGYLPWRASRSTISDLDGKLHFSFADDQGALFSQPLINLYIKPGPVNVRPRGSNRWQQVEVSLLAPTFTFAGEQGSIYDLRSWEVNRLTTADLDSQRYGSSLNATMSERIRDLRVTYEIAEIHGEAIILLSHGGMNRLAMHVRDKGWAIYFGDQEMAQGSEDLRHRRVSLALVDGLARVWIDDEEAMSALPIATVAVDDAATQTRLQVRGEGQVQFRHFAVDRDVHYTHDGIMNDHRQAWGQRLSAFAGAQEAALLAAQRAQILETRRIFIPALADERLRQRLMTSMENRDTGDMDWLRPLGVSPETALRVPAGGYLLLGDNSPFSLDSRTWGWVPAANMRGTVILGVLFPRVRRIR
ncbi:MAG: hypothetical protein EA402_07625 [Planctomycetota bacterium]|nr:MAG: hypothetical protein EA402_07625 [Planctomycetota bacterium]